MTTLPREARSVREELESQLQQMHSGNIAELGSYDALRARIVAAQREALLGMRDGGEIGDAAFHQIEAQLDMAEINALGVEYP